MSHVSRIIEHMRAKPEQWVFGADVRTKCGRIRIKHGHDQRDGESWLVLHINNQQVHVGPGQYQELLEAARNQGRKTRDDIISTDLDEILGA